MLITGVFFTGQVSLSGNFNKPVVPESPKQKVDDIFASISFSSPLQDIGRSAGR